MSAATDTTEKPTSWRGEIVRGLIVVAIVLGAWLAWRAIPSRHGDLLHVNGGELYYTSSVTRGDAERLGEYLVRVGHFNGERRRVQLTRDGEAYVVRYVVRAGTESNAATVDAFQFAAAEMSRELFDGQAVEVHLCDQGLRTLRIVNPTG
jgi:hypothetical protein